MAISPTSIQSAPQFLRLSTFGLCMVAVLLAACGRPGGEDTEHSALVDSAKNLQRILVGHSGIPAGVEGRGVSLSRPAAGSGAAPLNAVFSRETYEPRVEFAPVSGWDWSDAGDNIGLSMQVANPGEHSAQLFVTVYDGKTYGTRSFNVPAGEAGTYYFDLNGPALELETGMRDGPALYDNAATAMTWMWGSKTLDLSSIRRIELSMKSILDNRTLVFEDIALAPNGKFQPQNLHAIFDQYGQYAPQDYPEKVHSDDELRVSAQREAEKFSEQSKFADRSRFGGWAEGPRYEATGYFRTQKIGGQWALIDPEGYLFFATGVDNMRMDNTVTMTGVDFAEPELQRGESVVSRLRRGLFQWLPEEGDPLAAHYFYRPVVHMGPVEKGQGFSFYRANLQRKYGPDYLQRWREVTIDRQLDWGFTTLGNWADPSLYNNGKVAYVANGWIRGKHKRVSSGNDYWGPLHDPFDPEFVKSVKRTVAQVASEVQDDPWCMGVYIENELSWGNTKSDAGHFGLIIHTLSRDAAESPAKAAFVEILKTKYTSIENLSRAWSYSIPSWEAFSAGFELPQSSRGNPKIDGSLREDFAVLLESLSARFFSVVQSELATVMPNHLFLGARFADWGMTPEVVRGAAAHVDVVSYNLYTEGLAADNWDFLAEIDKPSIIGEFHMGATDSGSFHAGLVSAGSQRERGEMFRDYMHTIIDNPWFVGAQWFQYIDSPASGRAWDGENYNVGFVTVADEPYAPLVTAAQAVNRELYSRRYGQKND